MSRGPHAYLSDDERRERREASRLMSGAIRRGELVRGDCQVCGHGPAHGHHARGYSRPLDVDWLCASCHGWVHLDEHQRRFAESYRLALIARTRKADVA
jgi:hypothetical protein